MSNCEFIGKVKLNLDDYPGEDLYSDGPLEDLLLDFVKNNSESEYENFIEKQADWGVLYYLSPIRQNIISSLNISKDDSVLEIGAGCGAITGKLCQMSKFVKCIELSKKRSLINAYRNKNYENLEILLGNFEIVQKHITQKFDVITLIGVFEYGSLYIHSDKPYQDFLKMVMSLLNPGGRLYIAIENRLGIKYFAGCKEDHVGNCFEGIEGYTNSHQANTFSRDELINIFKECNINNYYFMYPYPDYKFPFTIFSDNCLPKKGELTRNWLNLDRERYMLFDETKFYDSITETELFKIFSNSFLVEIINKD